MHTVKVFFKVALSSLFLLLAAVLVTPAMAVTYTYTGNDFTFADTYPNPPGPTASDKLTGYFTLASPLTADMTYTDITSFVESFSFKDGVTTLTNQTENIDKSFYIATGSAGQITQWNIYLDNEPPLPALFPYYTFQVEDVGPGTDVIDLSEYDFGFYNYYQAISATPGSWTSDVASVPEPTTMLLLGSGLIGLAGLWRKFKK